VPFAFSNASANNATQTESTFITARYPKCLQSRVEGSLEAGVNRNWRFRLLRTDS
jgi:hypothetical protein